MNRVAEFRYYVVASHYESAPDGWVRISEDDFHEIEGRIECLWKPADPPPSWAQDLFRIARAAYVADKRSLRDHAADRWTRMIDLSVPLVEPDNWTGFPELLLHELLGTLTADVWRVNLRTGGRRYRAAQARAHGDWRAGEVALLSGGLDSAAWAARSARSHGDPLLLVTYHEGKLQARQNEIYHRIRELSQRSVHHRKISQTPVGPELELSARSRGFLFIATAVAVAAAHATTKVLVPENGQLAVNPPLTPARAAACSTRSVHPRTLHLINQVIGALGGTIQVINPFLDCTKGEVCREALAAGLPADVLERTISCGQPPIKRRGGRYYHCGFCFPCLIRRSGLHQALGDDHTAYETSLSDLVEGSDRAQHLRALQCWLCTPFEVHDLIADTPLPPHVTPTSLMPVLRRGRRELVDMIETLLPAGNPHRRIWRPIP